MGNERTKDQLGVERPEREVSEEKQPHPQAEVPGVRGAITSSGERADAPEDEVETFGSEGGAGNYKGGPEYSNKEIPPEGSGGEPA
ncbi:hypothetical protein [Sorangium sp. So ce131]|uniref:hypothetical protein n=1 Tax=Sorangium sp. So ce131 TaxID=3133282 RepID=UPI003F5DE9DC